MPIRGWNNDEVEAFRSTGSGVIAFCDWEANLLRGDATPCPPVELAHQLTNRGIASAYAPQDLARLTERLGYLSKFQSINSEDALTWSWFGTLAYSPESARAAVFDWLCEQIGVSGEPGSACAIELWPSVANPYHPGRKGPELDARISGDRALVYVEAKWHAKIGPGKGPKGGVTDQVALRRASLRTDPALANDARPFVVLVVSLDDIDENTLVPEEDPTAREVLMRWLKWQDLAQCDAHPLAQDFRRYLDWKLSLGA
jgi:hypothetical protein